MATTPMIPHYSVFISPKVVFCFDCDTPKQKPVFQPTHDFQHVEHWGFHIHIGLDDKLCADPAAKKCRHTGVSVGWKSQHRHPDARLAGCRFNKAWPCHVLQPGSSVLTSRLQSLNQVDKKRRCCKVTQAYTLWCLCWDAVAVIRC